MFEQVYDETLKDLPVKEIAADMLIGFFENTADYNYNFFSESSEYACENAYAEVTYDVVGNMEFDNPAQRDEFDQEIGSKGVKNIVKSLVAEMEELPEEERYDFLADTAGYAPAEEETISSSDATQLFTSLEDLSRLLH